jgi:hypothetical protein
VEKISLSGVAVIGITLLFMMALIVPVTGNARAKAKHAKCKSNLKNIGTGVAAYFADGVSRVYPDIEDCCDGDGWIVTMEVASEITACPVKAKNSETKYVYERGFKVWKGVEFKGSSEVDVAIDTYGAHNKKPFRYKVFEDAHVDQN